MSPRSRRPFFSSPRRQDSYNRYIRTKSDDYFKVKKEVAIQRKIAGYYEKGGNEKKGRFPAQGRGEAGEEQQEGHPGGGIARQAACGPTHHFPRRAALAASGCGIPVE